MEKRLKTLIIEDYKKAFENLDDIVSGKRLNGFVLKPNQYLTPSILIKDYSLEDPYGEFAHYNLICENLEKMLAGEEVKYMGRFRDASPEILNLMTRTA
ncbi:hypothetical protein KAI04_02470 [Candidatus Pacearchaeota archaeon]|nr:hypothetical protein [Candidatus Pacearchaeota archaeon]